jgi:hypothetical protein
MSVTINASTTSGLVLGPDNSGSIQLQNNGTTKLTVDSTGVYGHLIQGTVQTPTSGTAVLFTGIPSWAKKITIMMTGLTYSTSINMNMQIGSGSVSTSGYTSTGSVTLTSNVTGVSSGSGTGIQGHSSYTGPISGQFVWTLVNPSTNLWLGSGIMIYAGHPGITTATGYITLAGAADRVQINTTAGTATISAGSVNILYEG